jgi:hypothetical protein
MADPALVKEVDREEALLFLKERLASYLGAFLPESILLFVEILQKALGCFALG